MSVALLCCGIQFPDSTVQCTVANYSGFGTAIPVVCNSASGQVNMCLCTGNFFCVTASPGATWYPCITGDSSSIQGFYIRVCNPTCSFMPCCGNLVNDIVSHYVGYCNYYSIPCGSTFLFRAEKTLDGLCYELNVDNITLNTTTNTPIIPNPCLTTCACWYCSAWIPVPCEIGNGFSLSTSCPHFNTTCWFNSGSSCCCQSMNSWFTPNFPQSMQLLGYSVNKRFRNLFPPYSTCCINQNGCQIQFGALNDSFAGYSCGQINFPIVNCLFTPSGCNSEYLASQSTYYPFECNIPISNKLINVQYSGTAVLGNCLTSFGFICCTNCAVYFNSNSPIYNSTFMPCWPHQIIDTVNNCFMACDVPMTNFCICYCGIPCCADCFMMFCSDYTGSFCASQTQGPILSVFVGPHHTSPCKVLWLNGNAICSSCFGCCQAITVALSRLDNCTVCVITYLDGYCNVSSCTNCYNICWGLCCAVQAGVLDGTTILFKQTCNVCAPAPQASCICNGNTLCGIIGASPTGLIPFCGTICINSGYWLEPFLNFSTGSNCIFYGCYSRACLPTNLTACRNSLCLSTCNFGNGIASCLCAPCTFGCVYQRNSGACANFSITLYVGQINQCNIAVATRCYCPTNGYYHIAQIYTWCASCNCFSQTYCCRSNGCSCDSSNNGCNLGCDLLCWTYNGYNYQMTPTYYEWRSHMVCGYTCNPGCNQLIYCLRGCLNVPDKWGEVIVPFMPISLIGQNFDCCRLPSLFVWNKARCALVPNMCIYSKSL